MDIFKSEHRKLHELLIRIDTLTDSLRDFRGEEEEEEGLKKKKIMEKTCMTMKKTKTVKFIKVVTFTKNTTVQCMSKVLPF